MAQDRPKKSGTDSQSSTAAISKTIGVSLPDSSLTTHLSPPDPSRVQQDLAINHLREYMHEKKISAAVSFRTNSGDFTTLEIPEVKSSHAIHSVGKIFAGILVMRMIQEGVISEASLKKPLEEKFLETLPQSMQRHLRENKISLHELMTHRSGLGEYLFNYHDAIKDAIKGSEEPSRINQLEDLLKYAKAETFPVREFKYSSLNTLLVGLAVKHAFEKQYGTSCTYDDLLRRYIINDAKLSCFASTMPKNGSYNKEDKSAPYLIGGPAGGYWSTAEDLAKLGKWIYDKCVADEKNPVDRPPKLRKLMEDYGQEFYFPEYQCIEHGGDIPSSSAFFTVSLATGSIVSILSDQPKKATELAKWVMDNIVSPAPTHTPEISSPPPANDAASQSPNKRR